MIARLANSKPATLRAAPGASQGLRWFESPLITGLIMGVSIWLGVLLSIHAQSVSAIWLANGVIFVWLLPVPARRLPWHILCAALASVIAGFTFHFPFPLTLITTVVDIGEVVLMLLLTRRYYDVAARRFRITALHFTLLTIAVDAMVGIAISPLLFTYLKSEPFATIANWLLGDVLGMLVATALGGFWRRRAFIQPFQRPQLDGTLACIALVVVGSCLIFKQSSYSLLFAVISMLIYVVFKRGVAVGILCFAAHTIIASLYTLHAHGPLALLIHATARTQVVCLQVYLLVLLATIYPVGTALYEQQKLQSLYSVLADNTGDVILRADLNGFRQYCSPSVLRVLGWTPEEMLHVEAASSYHPEDALRLKALFQKMRDRQITSCVEPYRVRAKSGKYVWMEGYTHVLLDSVTGDPTGFIASFRDISERVTAEAKLRAAHHALQRLASTDPLTSLANRRTFDESLEREWRRARRERTPIALIMMDVDFFKKYNDALGHPAGDECMRRIALCLSQVVQRPSDVVARYGGEEFVALLPFTEASGAQQVAQRIMDALAILALHHPTSPTRATVTLSIGVASVFPSLGYSAASLVMAADRALYVAKNSGRNRIEIAQPESDIPARDAGVHADSLEAVIDESGESKEALIHNTLSRLDAAFDSVLNRILEEEPAPAIISPLL